LRKQFKCEGIGCNNIWSTTIAREGRDTFHYNFDVGFKVHPLKFISDNLGVNLKVQKE
jgi:hypothetical protein